MPRKDWRCPGQTRGLCGGCTPSAGPWGPRPSTHKAAVPRSPAAVLWGGATHGSLPWATLSTEVRVPRLFPNASQQISSGKTLSRFSKCFEQDGWFATGVSPQPDASHGVLKSLEIRPVSHRAQSSRVALHT